MRKMPILALATLSACGGGEFTATQLRILDATPALEASGTNDGADPPDSPGDAPDAILATDGQDGGLDAREVDSEAFDAPDAGKDSGHQKDSSSEATDSGDKADAADSSRPQDSGSAQDSYVVDSGSATDSGIYDSYVVDSAGDGSDGGCQAHSNGVGQSYYDCSPLGTYNATTAVEACDAYAEAMGMASSDCSDGWMCSGSSETFVCFSTDGMDPSLYCWEYAVNPGHVLVAGCPVDFTGHLWD